MRYCFKHGHKSKSTALGLADLRDRIPLSRGMYALIDPEDYERVSAFKWHAFQPSSGRVWYARTLLYEGRQRPLFMHRLILEAPKGSQVDHRNQDGLDNRRNNLRFATHSQNQWNRGKTRENSSGFKGVTATRNKQKWQAIIKRRGQAFYLGSFSDPAEAARAYDQKAREVDGEFARLNFPPEDRA